MGRTGQSTKKGRDRMLDEKDLQVIAQLMAQQRKDIMQDL